MRLGLTIACVALAATVAHAEDTLDNPVGVTIPYIVDSGEINAIGMDMQAAHSEVVHVPDAKWVRVFFGNGIDMADGSVLRVRSLFDNDSMTFDAAMLDMWNNSTPYFNGDSLLIEVIPAPGSRGNRLVIDEVQVAFNDWQEIGALCGICDGDDRVPSSELWSGRLMPSGCTASIINHSSCMVTAGHCSGINQVFQFNVPLGCGGQNPPALDQFPLVFNAASNNGVGDDWAVQKAGTNAINQTPYMRYGQLRELSFILAGPTDDAAVWGFGADTECETDSRQQVSNGTVTDIHSTYYTHGVDTTAGASGSGFNVDNRIVGIATHCLDSCPQNVATRIDHPDLLEVLYNQCAPPSNDLCGTAQLFFGVDSLPFDTRDATFSDSPDLEGCTEGLDGQFEADVWFNVFAPCDGAMTLSVCNAEFDAKMAVYDTNCPAGGGQLVACSDDSCGDGPSVTLQVQEFQIYKVRIGGSPGEYGAGELVMECVEGVPCPQDLNGDEVIDTIDLLDLLGAWGACVGCPQDLNGDNLVDTIDLLDLLGAWGACP